MTLKTRLALLLSFVLLTATACAPDENAEKEKIEQGFQTELKQIVSEKKRLAMELQQKIKERAAGRKTANLSELVPANDEYLVALNEVKQRQTDVLEQLVKNNPNNPNHKYNLALSLFEQNDGQTGVGILQKISPLETTGHPNGHMLLAKLLVGSAKANVANAANAANIANKASTDSESFDVSVGEDGFEATPANPGMQAQVNTKELAQANIKDALTHIGHCLKLNENNVEALNIQASLLNATGQFEAAREAIDRLFKIDPKYFSALCRVNARLGRQEENASVIDSAIEQFNGLLNQPEPLSDGKRLFIWRELSKCYFFKKDFATIEARLIDAFGLDSPTENKEGPDKMEMAGRQLLSGVYTLWAREFPVTTESSAGQKLELLKRAYQLGERNPTILKDLTSLAGNENESIANAAKSVYDAKKDLSAPPAVLAMLGSQELVRENYDSGILYLARARAVAPRNPEILNNLAYAYLKGDSSNAERALQLADEAVRLTTGRPRTAQLQSYFQDTRGQALMRLQRYQDAIVAFEVAAKTRPENTKIIEALIACYQQLGMPATNWENKLRKIQEASSVENGN